MPRHFSRFILAVFAAVLMATGARAGAAADAHADTPAAAMPAKTAVVFVIPVNGEIADPILYILRRGLKDAIAQKADLVVLDIDTLGGSAATALDMMDALNQYPGATATYVNDKAMSAGAFISAATQEIWFAPKGVIGAAAVVTSTGEDVQETMRLKWTSFLRGKTRAASEDKGYRGDVLAAMIDKDFELKIGDQVIKPKGELLTLTDEEAMKTYGSPPQPLLGAGIAKNIDDLLAKKFGAGNYVVTRLEVTWSERLAVWINAFSPVLIGLGLLAFFLEFKLPSHGAIATAGVVLLGAVFLGHYLAGFSGHEPVLVFAIGLILVALEMMFFHSAGFLGVVGLFMMLGSLVWSLADIWPGGPAHWGTTFIKPLDQVGLGVLIAVVLGAALAKLLPDSWFFDKLTVRSTVSSTSQSLPAEAAAVVGKPAEAATALAPSGYVIVDGRRYEAFCETGFVEKGVALRVVGVDNFRLIVTKP
jgi:membrane-bound serine protease (ClpP class)